MTNDPTSAAYEAIKEKIYPILHRYKYPDQYLPVLHDYAAKQKKRMEIVDEAEHDIFQSIVEAETRGRITGYHEACNDHLEHGQNWAITKASSLQANADGANDDH